MLGRRLFSPREPPEHRGVRQVEQKSRVLQAPAREATRRARRRSLPIGCPSRACLAARRAPGCAACACRRPTSVSLYGARLNAGAKERQRKVREERRPAGALARLVRPRGASSEASRSRSSLTSRCGCAIWRLSRARARGGVAQLVRAPACHAGGRGFKSRLSRQNFHSIEKPRTSSVRRFLRSFKKSARFVLIARSRSARRHGPLDFARFHTAPGEL